MMDDLYPEECTDQNPCGRCAHCLWSYEQYVQGDINLSYPPTYPEKIRKREESPEREFPRGMSIDDARQAVLDVAIAYIDQLCSYNSLTHPSVHRERLRLSEAVDAFHNSVETAP